MSWPAGGILLVTIGSKAASNSTGASRGDQIVDALAVAQREPRAGRRGGVGGGGEGLARQVDHELARGQRVVRAGVDPDQLGIADDRVAARSGSAAACRTSASSVARRARLWR